MTRWSVAFLACIACSLGITFCAEGADPLAAKLDAIIEAGAPAPVNPPVTDSEFLRRAYLDFAGRIPSVSEARAFLADSAAEKRERLLDKLFASPEFPRRWEEWLNQNLMERRTGDDAEWLKFVRHASESNMPWDAFARAIIHPNPEDEATRGSAYFYTNRLSKVGQQDTDYPGLTRDVGRMFLGVDLQCAQCHNHLFIDDYKQVDFQGLYTVYLNTAIRSDVKFPAVSENVMAKKIDFMSVFDKVPLTVGPRVPFFKEVLIPEVVKGEEFLIPPDKQTKSPGVPKFSPLAEIAKTLPTAENRGFAENLANRLWFQLMGRGLIHPLDQRHSANPPSHPEALKLLADEAIASKFDTKRLLRILASTKTYARSSAWPAEQSRPAEDRYQVAIERPVWAEQLLWSLLTATGDGKADARPRELPGRDDLRKKFLGVFSNPAKEPELDFSPSVKAALYLLNDSAVLTLVKPADGNLLTRVQGLKDPGQVADELYLAILTREPSDEERLEVAKFLEPAGSDAEQRTRRLGHLAWALLASTEFCLNH